jgi:hypothetical protein
MSVRASTSIEGFAGTPQLRYTKPGTRAADSSLVEYAIATFGLTVHPKTPPLTPMRGSPSAAEERDARLSLDRLPRAQSLPENADITLSRRCITVCMRGAIRVKRREP